MSKIIENYKLLDVLGEGSFGKVFKAIHMITNNVYAIKQVKNKFE